MDVCYINGNYGIKVLIKNGMRHSVKDQPSYISSDEMIFIWHKNGRYHRETGPALISAYTFEVFYFLDGIGYTFVEWCKKVKLSSEDKSILQSQYTTYPFDGWCKILDKSPEEITYLKLKYS